MILFAAATAKSLLLPTIKLSKVYLLLSPLLLVGRVFLMGVTWVLIDSGVAKISLARIFGLLDNWTSKVIFLVGRWLLFRASLIILINLVWSCLTWKEFLTPIITVSLDCLLGKCLETRWNNWQVKLSARFPLKHFPRRYTLRPPYVYISIA